MNEFFLKGSLLKVRKNFMYEQGFTIIELMVTLVIAGIIVSLAAPSFRDIIHNNRVTAAANEFTATMARAKSEAVKRNISTQIVPTGGSWTNGYTIGIDLNGDNDFADTDEVLLSSPDAPKNVTITSAMTEVEFNSLGGVSNAGTIDFDTAYACKRTITLSSSGTKTISKQSQPCY
jgi:type IV fimbrial biogenesis protein FimT